MTTNTLTCVYKLTAVGAVPVATLAARFAAVPIDISIPRKCGLLYFSDATATVGQVVTRTIVLRATPTTAATATASRFVGDVSGSPVQLLPFTGAGRDAGNGDHRADRRRAPSASHHRGGGPL